MIQIVNKDIFDFPELDIIVHQANCFCTMGFGIAKEIKRRFPAVYQADCQTKKGDKNKLGTISGAFVEHLGKTIQIVNLYSQYNYGHRGCFTDYKAMENGLQEIAYRYENENIGIPYGMGCNSAGGDWNIVFSLIQKCFKNKNIYICRV